MTDAVVAGAGAIAAGAAPPGRAAVRGGGFVLPVVTLAHRELVRFFRQRNRVVGSLLQPLIFWLLLGNAFRGSFRPGSSGAVGGGGADYLDYLYPGTIAMILLFSSIFSTITIIEDRNAGFLQGVLVAPISRAALVTGKVLGGTALAVLQAAVFLVLAPLAGTTVTVGSLALVVAMMLLVGFSMTALGFVIAWRCESTMGYHAIMSALLLPMWLMSGSMFPQNGLPLVLDVLVTVNPFTYGVALIRRAFTGVLDGPVGGLAVPEWWPSLGITVAFAAVVFLLARRMARTRIGADLL